MQPLAHRSGCVMHHARFPGSTLLKGLVEAVAYLHIAFVSSEESVLLPVKLGSQPKHAKSQTSWIGEVFGEQLRHDDNRVGTAGLDHRDRRTESLKSTPMNTENRAGDGPIDPRLASGQGNFASVQCHVAHPRVADEHDRQGIGPRLTNGRNLLVEFREPLAVTSRIELDGHWSSAQDEPGGDGGIDKKEAE